LAAVELASDYGWGPNSIFWLIIIPSIITAGVFVTVMATSRLSPQKFTEKKKYKLETIWAVVVAAILIGLYITSYKWMPPVAFSNADPEFSIANSTAVTASVIAEVKPQIVEITAGQWFWLMHKVGDPPLKPGSPSMPPQVTLKEDQTVKFIAHSIDVNHGFGVFSSGEDGSPLLFQMQVIPGLDNVVYYTFKEPGTYHVRCLEYCGFAHPYMTSQINVQPVTTVEETGGLPIVGTEQR